MNQTSPAKPTKRIAIAVDLTHVVPWHYDCCEGALQYGREQGWSCTVDPFLLAPGSPEPTHAYDGVVGRIDAEVAQAAREQGIPVVNHWMNSPLKDLPSVGFDNRAGGQLAGEHLLACGYRSLGLLELEDVASAPSVLEGLGRAAADAGLEPPTVCLFDQAFRSSSGREAFCRIVDEIDRWLAGIKTPIGVYVGDAMMAQYVAQRCNRLGLSVPGEVGIVAWSDDTCATAISPSLSALEHDWFAVGYQAAAMLDELMQGKAVHPQHRLVAPTRLIQRDSTDVFLCEDALVKEAMQYIAEHCRQELTALDVAEALHVSDRTLYRRFDEVLGRSIKDEIKRLRTDRLKLMVEETQMSLGEIAEMFGFSSSGQFSRYFSTAVGMPPSAYRKKFGVKEEG